MGLLSDIVYDVAFNENGLAYIATNQGISILQTPFSTYQESSQIAVSPNPFVIDRGIGLSIWNFPAGSDLQIMTLSGIVIKTFNLDYNESRIDNWDGVCSNSQIISSGIYYIVASNSNGKNAAGKLAVIK